MVHMRKDAPGEKLTQQTTFQGVFVNNLIVLACAALLTVQPQTPKVILTVCHQLFANNRMSTDDTLHLCGSQFVDHQDARSLLRCLSREDCS
jgi:hypothetical protein